MKKVSLKKILMLTVALGMTVSTFWSCDSKSGEDSETSEIVLNAPANNASIDLSTVDKITFGWTTVTNVNSYTIKFSPTEAGLATTNVTVDAGNASSYDLTSQASDNLLAGNTSTAPGESTDMYWTVVPATANPDVKTQTRKFNVKRLPVAVTPRLDVSTETLVFAASSAETQTVTVTSNIVWTVSITQTGDWLSANPVSGNGDGSASFTVTANTGAERTATVTISGTGVGTKTVNVTQAAAGGSETSALTGTWNLKQIEVIGVFEGMTATFTSKYARSFTLNENGTFTGEIWIAGNEASNNGDGIKTWSYANNSFTYIDNGFTITYRITLTSSELMFEYGTSGANGYGKAIYTRDAVTIPPVPSQITNHYTGNTSVFYGVWVLTKGEYGYSELDGSNPSWFSTSYNINDEVMKLTINSNGTFILVQKIGDIDESGPQTTNGTWSFANGKLTVNTGGSKSYDMDIEEASATTFTWASIEEKAERAYERMTWTKK